MTSYRRSPGVLWRLAGDRVLLRTVTPGEKEFDLRGPEAVLWIVIDKPRSLAELSRALEDAGSASAQAQTADAVEALRALGLLKRLE